jgi:hypothetical protein
MCHTRRCKTGSIRPSCRGGGQCGHRAGRHRPPCATNGPFIHLAANLTTGPPSLKVQLSAAGNADGDGGADVCLAPNLAAVTLALDEERAPADPGVLRAENQADPAVRLSFPTLFLRIPSTPPYTSGSLLLLLSSSCMVCCREPGIDGSYTQ